MPRLPRYVSLALAMPAASSIYAFAPESNGHMHAVVKGSECSFQQSSPLTPRPNKSRGSSLRMSRDNSRARMEKNWEDMMGEDWREFRAHLVAREQAEAAVAGNTQDALGSASKDEKIGNFFSGALSSIFSTKESSIFDGDSVGGATEFSKIGMDPCEDPFLSDQECKIIYEDETKKVGLDKHRWAHPLFHVEPGCILVANEKLGGVFHQTVVLIIEHTEATGSTGIIINRPFPDNLLRVASDVDSNVDLSLKMAFSKAPVAYGGPVMQEEFSTLHGYGEVTGSKKVCPGVFVGGSNQLMQEVRRSNMHPSDVLFVKGHAAWVPGQLKREVDKGVWYIAAASPDFILRYAGAPIKKDDNAEDLWADILSCMGEKFDNIASSHSGRGDDRMMP